MEDFISFELAEKLKEKGFNKYSIKAYTKIGVFDNTETYKDTNEFYCYAPTISQVLKWLREDKEIMVFPIYSRNTSRWYCSIVNADSLAIYNFPLSDSYEQAALVGIEYVLDNLI